MVKPKSSQQSKQWMQNTHTPNKPIKFKQTSVCQKADGNCFLGQERIADGGIRATRDHNNVRSVLRNNKKLRGAIQNKKRGILTSGVVLSMTLRVRIQLLALTHC
jgi:hypothetical protein